MIPKYNIMNYLKHYTVLIQVPLEQSKMYKMYHFKIKMVQMNKFKYDFLV